MIVRCRVLIMIRRVGLERLKCTAPYDLLDLRGGSPPLCGVAPPLPEWRRGITAESP